MKEPKANPCANSEGNSHLFEGVIAKRPPQIVAGKGVRISVTKDGKLYEDMLDAATGAAVGSLGWGDEEVYDIVNSAIREHTYSFPTAMGNSKSEELAQFYIENSPEGVFESALWTTSGSESNESAMRIIRQYQLESCLLYTSRCV